MEVSLPCGIFNTRYEQDMAVVRTKAHWAWLSGGIIFSFLVPPLCGPVWFNWATETCIVIIAVLGLYFVTGLCGQISLGQAGFMAIGAYTTAILMGQTGISFWLVLPAAAIITAVVAVLFGIPSLRVRGLYLAMATLAAQYLIIWILTHPPLRNLSRGVDGLFTPPPRLGTITFDSYSSWFYVVAVFTWLLIYFAENISRTKAGRAFVAIRDAHLAAEVQGINTFRYKVLAFFLSGIYAGVAGALFAPYVIVIAPDNFNMEKAIWYLGMLIVGGHGSIVGAILGVIFVRLVLEVTSILGPTIHVIPWLGPHLENYFGEIIFGFLVIMFLIFEARGINQRWTTLKSWWRLHPFSY